MPAAAEVIDWRSARVQEEIPHSIGLFVLVELSWPVHDSLGVCPQGYFAELSGFEVAVGAHSAGFGRIGEPGAQELLRDRFAEWRIRDLETRAVRFVSFISLSLVISIGAEFSPEVLAPNPCKSFRGVRDID